MAPGARVLIRYLDNDVDRPVICAALLQPANVSKTCITLDGAIIETIAGVQLENGQRLHIATGEAVTLHAERAELRIDAQSITIMGAASLATFAAPLNNP